MRPTRSQCSATPSCSPSVRDASSDDRLSSQPTWSMRCPRATASAAGASATPTANPTVGEPHRSTCRERRRHGRDDADDRHDDRHDGHRRRCHHDSDRPSDDDVAELSSPSTPNGRARCGSVGSCRSSASRSCSVRSCTIAAAWPEGVEYLLAVRVHPHHLDRRASSASLLYVAAATAAATGSGRWAAGSTRLNWVDLFERRRPRHRGDRPARSSCSVALGRVPTRSGDRPDHPDGWPWHPRRSPSATIGLSRTGGDLALIGIVRSASSTRWRWRSGSAASCCWPESCSPGPARRTSSTPFAASVASQPWRSSSRSVTGLDPDGPPRRRRPVRVEPRTGRCCSRRCRRGHALHRHSRPASS